MDNARLDVLGVGFDDLNIEQAVSVACDLMHMREKTYIATPNPEIVWMCRKNEGLRAAVNGAGLVLPDGIGIILGARILKTPLRGGRVPGIDFTAALLRKMAEFGGSVFLLGAKPAIAEEAGEKLADEHPGLKIAGVADGYFEQDGPVIEMINRSAPDLLLVCLGAPKQELWMSANRQKLDVPICIGLGGSLDVFAGKAKRAPAVFRKVGLEWFYRLVCQPSRIKRMVKLPLFIFAVLLRRLRQPSAK